MARRSVAWAFLALIVLFALVICVDGESEKKKSVKRKGTNEELLLEDFSWEFSDMAEQTCTELAIKLKRRHQLRLCAYFGKTIEMVLDHTIGTVLHLLVRTRVRARAVASAFADVIALARCAGLQNHRKTDVERIFTEPFFAMQMVSARQRFAGTPGTACLT